MPAVREGPDFDRISELTAGYHLSFRLDLWVPRRSPTSCDQVVFVDHAADLRMPSDAVLLKIDRFR